MATYRNIHTSFWQDAFVLDLTPEEKYFYLYLMTNSKTTQCGVYELPKKVMELETGYNRETVDKLLERFVEYGKIEYCDKTREVLLKNWHKHNSSKSPKVKACITREATEIKHPAFRKYCIDTLCIDLGEEEEKEEEKEEEQKEEQKEEEEVCMHGAKPVPEPAFIQLPLNDKSFYPVTFTAMDGWRELYPIVDIEQELRKMKGWLDSNPKKRKTSRGIKAFINGWLAREQDKGRQPTKGNTANPFDELLRKELQNEQSRNNSPYEDNQRLLPGVLPEG